MITTLDSVDEKLGLLVMHWGKLCNIAMKYSLKALTGREVPAMDEVFE